MNSSNAQHPVGYADDVLDTAPDDQESGTLDLRHCVRTLRKHRIAITAVTLTVTLLAAYYAFTSTPVYRATVTLLIEQQKANVVSSIEELYGVDSAQEDYYQTQYELLKSRNLAERVIEDLDLWSDPLFLPSQPDATARDDGFLTQATQTFDNLFEPGDAATSAGAPTSTPAMSAEEVTAPDDIPAETGVSDALQAIEAAAVREEITPSERRKVINGYLGRLVIAPKRKTKLVDISFESPDPEQAALIANAVAENYITSHLERRMELTTKASGWLNDRVVQLRDVLQASESKLIEYKRENGLIDVDGSIGRLNDQELFILTQEFADARSELASAEDLFREIQSIRNSPELLEALPIVRSDEMVSRVKIEQGRARRDIDELLNRYGQNHPRVVDARSALNAINDTLSETIGRVVAGAEKEYVLLQQRVASLQIQMNAFKQNAESIGAQSFVLDALESEVDTNRRLYETFYSRLTETRSSEGLESANAQVADRADPPVQPVRPKKQLIVALAALGSLVLSMLMALLYEQLDDTVQNTNDIERALGLPLLGMLPLLKEGKFFSRKKDMPLAPSAINDPKNTFHESMNTVRTVLLGEDQPRRSVVVTSSIPGEGKSTTALNLAWSMSRTERVLLIDADMRRPSIDTALGMERGGTGLVDVVTGRVLASDAIVSGVLDGAFDVLRCGKIPNQPLEILSSPRFRRLLDRLCTVYDRVVIDAAPTLAVSDAVVLSRLCDTTIYVVKSQDTSMELAKSGVKRLKAGRGAIAGVVVSQVDVEKLAAYGGDFYYQGYYDYYGYSKGSRNAGNSVQLAPEEIRNLHQDPGDDFDLGPAYENDHPDIDISDETIALAEPTRSDSGRPSRDAHPADEDRRAPRQNERSGSSRPLSDIL